MSSPLQAAISNADSTPLPASLPLGHLRDSRYLDDILKNSHIPLHGCKVFNQDLVYLFYGGLFYRTLSTPTKDGTLLPVGFLFAPSVLRSVERAYPFDTGAAHKDKYGAPWDKRLKPLQDFEVDIAADSEAAAKLVRHFFKTNTAYLDEKPLPACDPKSNGCSVLHEFLSADLTGLKIDQRYARIEAHAVSPVPLIDLLWVGYPKHIEAEITRLKRNYRSKPPIYWSYKPFPAMPPNEAAAILQHEAERTIISQYIDPQGNVA
jgi:hypothetical protein